MIEPGDVVELEAEALKMYEEAKLDPERPASPVQLCFKLFGTKPIRRKGLPRPALMGIVKGEVRIYVESDLFEPRANWLMLHEVSHARLGPHCASNVRLERRCDLLAACCAAPAPAVRAMVKTCGHSVYDLAHAFGTTQALALLRLAEVEGRPVKLLGDRERVRGASFDWPDTALVMAGKMRKVAHPIRLVDEDKWALMATR